MFRAENKRNYIKGVLKAISLSFLCIACCRKENDTFGYYFMQSSENIVDSLFLSNSAVIEKLLPNTNCYSFLQKTYNRKTNKMIMSNKGIWWLECDKITFRDLYLDVFGDTTVISGTSEHVMNARTMLTTKFEGNDIVVNEELKYIKVN